MKQYVDFQGRACRREFGFFCLFVCLSYILLLAVVFVLGAIIGLMAPSQIADKETGFALGFSLGTLFSVAHLFPFYAVTARHLHDIGLSRWYVLYHPFCLLTSWATEWWVSEDLGRAFNGPILGMMLFLTFKKGERDDQAIGKSSPID